MLIPPLLRPGVVALPRPSQARVIRYRIRGFILLLRVLLLCFHTAAHADKALPAPAAPRPAPNFLEAVATDYANSHVFYAVEGIVPVREPRAAPAEPAPAPQTPASAAAIVSPAAANIRRVNAR
ncbi:hypothetical protein [Cupriavidus pauculus]|uniref:Uncharacterized protein n=1 Tax=Cupriavidus pauculus TaxID=82633 RepID=A0A2N5CBQ3_9BURK|nr:hypothetical protein [Cupriavidus pauculus]PLP99614.1 hypothetical protein CYJ10_14475 [Cupriavidus pauculus]